MDFSQKAWESMSTDEVRRLLAVDFENGLTLEEVDRRLALYGKNVLIGSKETGIFAKVLLQFKSSLSYILIGAGMVTLLLEEYIDSLVIFIAVIINVIIGTLQEERASKAFQKLNTSQERHALVFREGKKLNILAENLVPGDIVALQGGYLIPADIRIVEEKDLKVNEAALTGEWLAVSKSKDQIALHAPLAEQTNMLWMGTLIESGHGRGVVVATGEKTEIGKIALSLQTISEQTTPLQKNIKNITRFLTYVVVIALACILFIGFIQQRDLLDMLLVAIATAVATVPSGLPAAVTVVLAVGMESILKRGGLVRNLLAAETLGATTVILTDKTGTLTEARMKLASLHSYSGIRDHREGPDDDNKFLLEQATLMSDAFIEETTDASAQLVVHGRPIEKAVVLSALEAGISQEKVLEAYPRLDYLQFTSTRRFGASLHKNPAKKTNRLILSGEPEKLLEASQYIRVDGKRVKVTPHERKRLSDVLRERTLEGKRLICLAYRDVSIDSIPEETTDAQNLLDGIVFAGFIAFEDPIRTDVAKAIAEVKEAGAQVIMLTGDNPETAHYIAQQVGITQPGDELVIRGDEIEELDDAGLYTKLQRVRVIARATPAHKLRIAQVLKSSGEVVAMTGDGINDAPALRAASIGVAVGSGTEVAKEASDLVLIDNSFSIIVSAIEEGRRIIDNLKKIIAYLLSTSFSEIFVIGGALAIGGPLPLVPTQILWANIVEEGLMSFSFAFEGRDPHAMKRDPRSAASKNILTKELRKLIILVSLTTGLLLVGLYYWLNSIGLPEEEMRTVMFVALSLDAIFFSFSLKSLDTPVWKINVFSNKYLLFALLTSISLLLLALTWNPLMTLLSITPLTSFEKLLLVGVGIMNLATIELMKFFLFERDFQKTLVAEKLPS
ncbi:MAG: ATPase, P-type (Transporting), HAD superfamily, subfamily IC [Parcubacteria group bacterium GW2011_GWA2_43_11]|nr:MAG: ATPase, P-type (Transporting), HAD superfamily, subfamily IC [Parcubacteria group bacterium GW2011_GWC2_42_11]KKS86428.1 MAG: ATPase, P-type (Transporting), HAD superfamily, subfamily IC [Parcubacteria group bacterium GW2011_GWA2_43_11]